MKKRKIIIRNYINGIDIEKMIMEKHNKEHLIGLLRMSGFMDIDYLNNFDHIEAEQDIKDIVELIVESLVDSEIFPSRFSHKQFGKQVFVIEVPDPSLFLLYIILKHLVKKGHIIENDGLYSTPPELKRPNYNPRTFVN